MSIKVEAEDEVSKQASSGDEKASAITTRPREPFSNNTARFLARKVTLSDCFSAKKLEKYWRDYVRAGMRNQAYPDLHDNYDFHRNLSSRVAFLRAQILEGRYRPSAPSFVRLEKSKGICRRLAIPDADDALVLQAIVEAIAPRVRAAQPTENCFYSRNHSSKMRKIGVFSGENYIWFKIYKKFFGRLVEIAGKSEYIIVTDLANYFDSIEFSKLRNAISGMGSFDEAILDFLFFMLDNFCWRSDFMPHSGRGLPQLDFDAPRLLGHCFLFEADSFLANEAGVSFVRWMDDIDISVNSVGQAHAILRDLSDLLSTKGISLNSAKTKVLDQNEAIAFLWTAENHVLDKLEVELENFEKISSKGRARIRSKINSVMRKAVKKSGFGRWDKVLKRCIGLSAKCLMQLDPAMFSTFLQDNASLREAVFRYIEMMGPSQSNLDLLIGYIKGGWCIDDVSEFQACRVMINWEVEPNSEVHENILKFASNISADRHRNFLAAIWIMAKYADRRVLGNFISMNMARWINDSFLSRQIAALYPRIWTLNTVSAPIYRSFASKGMTQALHVVNNLQELRRVQKLSKSEFEYLCGSKSLVAKYTLEKALIAIAVLSSEELEPSEFLEIKRRLLEGVSDPIYKKWFSSFD